MKEVSLKLKKELLEYANRPDIQIEFNEYSITYRDFKTNKHYYLQRYTYKYEEILYYNVKDELDKFLNDIGFTEWKNGRV